MRKVRSLLFIRSNGDSDCPDSVERDNWFTIFLIFFSFSFIENMIVIIPNTSMRIY